MRKMWIFLLSLIAMNAFSAEVICYANKTRIYHGYGHHFVFKRKYIAFIENKTNDIILIDADCIIIYPKKAIYA